VQGTLAGGMQGAGDFGWWNARNRGFRIAGSKTECLLNPVKEEVYSEGAIRGEGILLPIGILLQ